MGIVAGASTTGGRRRTFLPRTSGTGFDVFASDGKEAD